MTDAIKTYPVQQKYPPPAFVGRCPACAVEAAYEVYCEVFGKQPAMMIGDCRGGFGIGELIAFLYARSFPKKEWRERVDDAFKGMKNI